MVAAKSFSEWYAFLGGEEMAVSRDDAAVVWEAATKAAEARFTSHNNGSTPCQFFSRDKVSTGKAADGGNMYQSVPWCNHEPSQRAVP